MEQGGKTILKTEKEYIINFYHPKGSKTLDDTVDFDNKRKAISALKYYKKRYDQNYDIKLFKATTVYEEIKIEK